jgi:hypothetical protein
MAFFYVIVPRSIIEVYGHKGMTEAASISETSVNFYQITRRSKPEDSQLHTCRCENLKYYIKHTFCCLSSPTSSLSSFLSWTLSSFLLFLLPPVPFVLLNLFLCLIAPTSSPLLYTILQPPSSLKCPDTHNYEFSYLSALQRQAVHLIP